MKARITGLAVTAVVAGLFAVQPAGAAVTIGSSLAGPADDAFGCSSSCTVVQSTIAGQIAQAPTDGVIVRWRIKTDAPGGPFALQVARPAVGDARIGVGTSAEVMTAAGGISEFPTRIAVRQGDNIGLNFTSANNSKFTPDGADAGATTIYFNSFLINGQSNLETLVNTDTEFLVNADLEPDADSDGFGDETQDKCLGQNGESEGCDRVAPSPTLTVFSKVRYRQLRATITSSEPVSVAASAQVTVRIGKRRKVIRAKTVNTTLATGIAKTVRFQFTRKSRGQLKALLESRRKLKAVVSFKLVDAAGNSATASRSISLKL